MTLEARMAKKVKKAPPKPAPKDKDAGKVVWISCRARDGCDGKQAIYVMKHKLPQGGTSYRYRCKTCGGAFHITA